MGLISSITTFILSRRIRQIQAALAEPGAFQQDVLLGLMEKAKRTEPGRQYEFDSIRTYEDFRNRVPVSSYEEVWPSIERMMRGEEDVLWPGRVKLFSKSSGTTSQRSKFIPVSDESLQDCHYKGGKDMIALYLHNHQGTDVLSGKNLAVGGSLQKNPHQPDSYMGDVSALIMNWLPAWAQIMRTPSLDVAIMPNWEEKLDKIARLASQENVTSLSGVPTWMVLLIQRVMELNQATDLRQVWPNLEVFLHGAVSFTPYRSLFDSFTKQPMHYMETYNASEGFFGIQDRTDTAEGVMALMVDYGIFYEFIPVSEHRRTSDNAIPLWEVKPGVNYALVITTNGGLWRYQIGDTIRFTDTNPYRFRISGRTKHYINAFGEEVVIENAEAAISHACMVAGGSIANFTAAPIYMGGRQKASHEWVIEFEQEPDDLQRFSRELDEKLREVNSDYDAKRHMDMALHPPVVHSVPKGTFYRWLESKGKLGGQNKVPRLSNTREFVEEILQMAGTVRA